MEILAIIGGSILILISVIIVILVTVQDSKQNGLQGLGASPTDSFLSKNKGKTLDAKLSKLTMICAIIFFVLVIGLNFAMAQFK